MYACRNATNNSSTRISKLSIVTGAPIPICDGDARGHRDQEDQRRQHDVAGDHVREKTNHQRERLDQRADQLQDQKSEPHRDVGDPADLAIRRARA